MAKKIVLLTGSTGAIGRAAAEALAKNGVNLVLLARDAGRGEKLAAELRAASGNPDIEVLVGDLADRASLKKAAADFKAKHPRLDALLNVAAIYKGARVVDAEGIESMYGTNHLGPFLLTNLLLDTIKASAPSRIVLVTAPATNVPDFDDLQAQKKFSAMGQFIISKVCNSLFGAALARRLEGTGVTVMMMHPGFVRSNLMGEMSKVMVAIFNLIAPKPTKAGNALARLALDPEFEKANGKFFKLTSPMTVKLADQQVQERLWTESAKACGIAT